MMDRIPWVAVFNTAILIFVGLLFLAVYQGITNPTQTDNSKAGLPYYSTANPSLIRSGTDLYKKLQCRSCHTIWSIKSLYETVPAPSLDGIGSWRTEEWLYTYFSSKDPQSMVPTRLKKKYRMPSYADLPEQERRLLAEYFSSLKVKGWYLKETRKAEQRKLTGK